MKRRKPKVPPTFSKQISPDEFVRNFLAVEKREKEKKR